MSVAMCHELLHALGVRHHGDGDYDVVWKVDGTAVKEFHVAEDGRTPVGSGTPIRVLKQDGTDVTAKFVERHADGSETLGIVGVEQGESSGDDTCMMRYDRNSAYLTKSAPDARVLVQPDVNPESVGSKICTSRTGTGINAASPGPSRYGNAAPGRGACMEKIKVSDI